MNAKCCFGTILKGPRQTLTTEPTQTWLGPARLSSHDWTPSLSLKPLPASPPWTEQSPVLKDSEVWNTLTTESKHQSFIWNKNELKWWQHKQQQERTTSCFTCNQKGLFTALTSSPAVQAAAHPWHPDLEQGSLGEFLLLCVNCESHEALLAGSGQSDWGSVICVHVCASLSTTAGQLTVIKEKYLVGRKGEELRLLVCLSVGFKIKKKKRRRAAKISVPSNSRGACVYTVLSWCGDTAGFLGRIRATEASERS